MTERLADFLQSIRAGLSDMPAGSRDQALLYYEEYIADALEAGLSEDEILAKLDKPETIIAAIYAERLIDHTETKPGPVGLMRASQKAFGNIALSALKVSLVVGALIPIILASSLYLLAVATLIGAFTGTVVVIYGMIRIPAIYVFEKIGTAGLALLVMSLLTGLGIGWWRFANYITRITMRTLRKLVKQKQDIAVNKVKKEPINTVSVKIITNNKKWLLIFVGTALLGTCLLLLSGLPLRYFSIWNSMKPGNLTYQRQVFDPDAIRNILVSTLNSRIEIQTGNVERISIAYEQPDWMKGMIELQDNALIFQEKSNGRLPFMDFIAIHAGMTTVRIEVPKWYIAKQVSLESTGGHLRIAIPAQNIQAHTVNGNLRFKYGNGLYSIKAATRNGTIFAGGVPLATKTYQNDNARNRIVTLESINGTIEID